jgi:hypothetical protein
LFASLTKVIAFSPNQQVWGVVSPTIHANVNAILFHDGIVGHQIIRDLRVHHRNIKKLFFSECAVLKHTKTMDREWGRLVHNGQITGLAFSSVPGTLGSEPSMSHSVRKWIGPFSGKTAPRMKSLFFGNVPERLVGTMREYAAKHNSLTYCLSLDRNCSAAAVERIMQAIICNYRLGKVLNDDERKELEDKDPIDIRYVEDNGPAMSPATPAQLALLGALSARNSDDNSVNQEKLAQNAEIQRRLALGVTHQRIHDILAEPNV